MDSGIVNTCKLNLLEDRVLVTAVLNINTINGYVVTETPVAMPYGICTIPEDGTTVLYQSLGGEYTSYVVTNIINANHEEQYSNLLELKSGESALYNSVNFTYQLKKDGAYHIFNGATAGIKTKLLNGTNTDKILIDTLNEIEALENYIIGFVTLFNAHIHSGGTISGNTGPSSTTETPFTPGVAITTDKPFLNESPKPNFIDINGKVL